MTKGADFLIAGFNRCGTSTLHQILAQHPDLCMSNPKELHYFNFNNCYAKGLEWYDQFFAHGKKGQLKGDATPSYIYKGVMFDADIDSYQWQPEDDSLKRIKNYNPDIKIIISLRHPLDGALSSIEKAKVRGIESPKSPVHEILEAEWSGRKKIEETYNCHFYLTRYALHVEYLLSLFPRENILFLVFEDWVKDQQGTLNKVTDFLRLERHTLNLDKDVRTNEGVSMKIPGLQKALMAVLPERVAYAILIRFGAKKGYDKPQGTEYQKLASAYAEDVARLQTLTGLDLSLWNIPKIHDKAA